RSPKGYYLPDAMPLFSRPTAESDPASPLAAAALACLGDLAEAGEAPRPESACAAGAGWTVLLIVCPWPPGADAPGLDACERGCLQALRRSGVPLLAKGVRRSMRERGLGEFKLAPVRRALKRLSRLRLVRYEACSPRGFCLADLGPLFRTPGAA